MKGLSQVFSSVLEKGIKKKIILKGHKCIYIILQGFIHTYPHDRYVMIRDVRIILDRYSPNAYVHVSKNVRFIINNTRKRFYKIVKLSRTLVLSALASDMCVLLALTDVSKVEESFAKPAPTHTKHQHLRTSVG